MKVVIKLEAYRTAVADLTGQELETLTKIIDKLTMVEERYLAGAYHLVVAEQPKADWEYSLKNYKTVTQDEAKIMKNADVVLRLAQGVADLVKGGTPDAFLDCLWYADVITSEQKRAASWEPDDDIKARFRIAGNQILRVTTEGEVIWAEEVAA